MSSADAQPLSSRMGKLFLLFILVLGFAGCGNHKKLISVDPEFAKYIEAYTSGTVSKTSPIIIKLTEQVSVTHTLNEPVSEKLFSFDPSVSGTAVWTDERTIEFRPDKQLEPGKMYEVEFYLGKVAKVPSQFRTFRFNVQVLLPSFAVTNLGLKTEGDSREKMVYTGQIETADEEDTAAVQKLVNIVHNGKPMPLQWMHDAANRKHTFWVAGIQRTNAATEMKITWDGSPIHASEKGSETVMVPAVGDFKVLNVLAVNDPETYALVQFSAPIAPTQDLTGLILLSPDPGLSYTINGSEVKLFSEAPLEGDYALTVNPGVEDIWAEKLNVGYSANVVFENKKPYVKILGNGEILPNSGKLTLPFEACNLKAVDVAVIRIYESNIPQFFQVNDLGGDNELRRVGKPLVQKTIPLDGDKNLDLGKRNRFALDLDKLIRTEPGAMYRITIGFRPEYSVYTCDAEETSGERGTGEGDYYYDEYDYYGYYNDWSDEDDSFWSRYDEYYPYGYDWEQRDNPCHPSYYNKEKWQSRNIIASNIGLTVKKGNDNSMTVLVTNLITADPMSGVQLEVLDYQQQVIHTATSDGSGMARFEMKHKPFLLVAKHNKERGYLKLDDGSSLLMSRFDVEGEEVQEGIKGFIFGERGVWRPGDSIFVSFILEDKSDRIPDDHPVEFELFTPKGQVYRKMVANQGLNGYYVFRTATDPSAPTGNWTARVKVGGAKFEKRLKIETIMPNRLKINLDFGDRKLLGMAGDESIALSSQWLFGAPARNLRAKVDMTLTAQPTAFDKYKEYEFNDPANRYETQLQTVFDGKLNEEGHTDFNLLAEGTENAPGMLKASFTVKVFEPGGAYSIDHVSMPYSPFESYVGIKVPKGEEPFNYLVTGKNYTMDIVNVNAQGMKINSSGEVDAELYKLEWRWWWDNSDNSVTNYTSSSYSKLIKSAKVKLSNGAGRWTVAAPQDGWGRYLLVVHDPVSGHTAGRVVYFDDPYWQTRSHGDDATTATMLSFSSDKTRYNVGDNVKLNVPSSENGRMFISIENGRKVLKTYWVETRAGQTPFEFTADASMAPNVYVHISLFQPHAQTVNDAPIRMYGVIPILVEDKNTVLSPVIQMADVLRPEQPSSLTVAEANGRDMTYSIAIVDEGLLDLTRYKTPDPHGFFYSREALGVRTWDLYDHVIGAFGGQLERILTIGGDEDLYGLGKQHGANRFRPVVKFMGPFYLKKGQKQSHSFRLPQYIGSIRVMVVAEQDAAYGNAEKTVAVKNPLMMLATLPRVIGPSEQIKIPVTVFASEKYVKNVSVQLTSNPMLEVIGESRKSLTFSGIGEQTVYFDAKVKSTTGTTVVKLQSTSGNEKAVSEVELQVRNPNPPVTRINSEIVQGNNQWKIDAGPIGVPNNSQAVLELSSAPPMNLQKRLSYLVQYPHGCIEQTTSAVFPQLVLGDLMDLTEKKKKEVQANINAGIRKIVNFQTADGGFSYWPGSPHADEWGTNYAGHFLLEAKARGYSVPDDVLRSWLRYQRSRANRWSPTIETVRTYGADLVQSYRLYLLALAKAPEVGAMNRLKEFAYLSSEGKWRLAAAYKLAGYDQVAGGMISGLPVDFPPVMNWGISYGSRLRDQAMVLETMVIMGRKQQAGVLVTKIAAQLATEDWLSTQTTAYCLLSIAKFNGLYRTDKKINATVTINGKSTTVSTGSVVAQVPVDVSKGTVPVTVVNKNGAVLYARLVTEGQPLPGEDVQMPVGNGRLRLTMEFLTQGGEPLKVDQLTQGTDFVAKITVTNPGGYGRYTELALSEIFPSGWEIMNTRIWDEDSPYSSSSFDYQDIRDDRVYTYFDLGEKETRTYYVMLNAAYMGKYYLPMLGCEAMYDHSLSATVPGKWVEVVQ